MAANCQPLGRRPDSGHRLQLTPLRASANRITRVTVCTRSLPRRGPALRCGEDRHEDGGSRPASTPQIHASASRSTRRLPSSRPGRHMARQSFHTYLASMSRSASFNAERSSRRLRAVRVHGVTTSRHEQCRSSRQIRRCGRQRWCILPSGPGARSRTSEAPRHSPGLSCAIRRVHVLQSRRRPRGGTSAAERLAQVRAPVEPDASAASLPRSDQPCRQPRALACDRRRALQRALVDRHGFANGRGFPLGGTGDRVVAHAPVAANDADRDDGR